MPLWTSIAGEPTSVKLAQIQAETTRSERLASIQAEAQMEMQKSRDMATMVTEQAKVEQAKVDANKEIEKDLVQKHSEFMMHCIKSKYSTEDIKQLGALNFFTLRGGRDPKDAEYLFKVLALKSSSRHIQGQQDSPSTEEDEGEDSGTETST